MLKKVIFALAFTTVMMLFAGCGTDSGTGAGAESSTAGGKTESSSAGESSVPTSGQTAFDAAKETALSDAGVSASEARFTKERQDWEDGVLVYEFEFYTQTHEYDYEIDAATGAILKKEKKSLSVGSGPGDNIAGQISLDAAKEAALADAGVSASEAYFTREKLDREKGVLVYELEFRSQTHEYDYEIDAATGAVRGKEIEPIAGGAAPSGSGSLIDAEKAKATAAGHAGLSVSDVVFSKVELEREDGRPVYEIKFHKNGMEYEYEIDAATGAVIQYEVDRD